MSLIMVKKEKVTRLKVKNDFTLISKLRIFALK